MDTFDRVMVTVIILGTSILVGTVATISSKKFTCEQMDKVYLAGKCVKLTEE